MKSINFSKKMMEISQIIARKGDGISYIHNDDENYVIGTKKYNEQIAQYLDQTVKSWKGSEADLSEIKMKKGKANQIKKVAYLWKIPLNENNLIDNTSEKEAEI